MRLLLLNVAMSVTLGAQAFQGLSTTDDGSVLYFSSPIRQKGTTRSFHSKIFRWDAAGGFQVVAEVADEGNLTDCVAGPNFYELLAPQVSSDGTLLAYTGNRPELYSQRFCVPYEPNQGVLEGPGAQVTLAGNIAISRNGRYAVTTPMTAVAEGVHIITDLVSSQSKVVAGAFNGSQQRVTDDGTILTPPPAAAGEPQPSAIILTDRNGGTRVLNTQRQVSDAVISRSGGIVVYMTQLTGPNVSSGISSIDVASGAETQLLSAFSPGNLSLTSDGTTVLFTNMGQLYTVVTAGGQPQQITTDPAGISSAIISGNGQAAYAVTGDSRLIRIDVASHAVTELAPATPLVTAAYRIFPPATTIAALGSVMQLYGSGMPSVNTISLCGRTVPALAGQVRFQVPWDLPAGACQAVVQSTSPFEHAIDLEVQEYDPQFVETSTPAGLLLHQNFIPITSTNPAQPGEVIVAYMNGLGPVDNNGLIMPGFQCRFESTPGEILYAGVAPGLLGFYQINIRVPELQYSSAPLTCGWNALMEASTSVWLGPP